MDFQSAESTTLSRPQRRGMGPEAGQGRNLGSEEKGTPRTSLEAAPVLTGEQCGHSQSGSESGSEESRPSMLSHMASCREVRWPRGLTPMGWMTLCL